MQPTTEYWPPTRSPACSFGANEYGVRHFGQKPSVRPAAPSRARPTGAAHAEQNRFSSGTEGSVSTIDRGSAIGVAGTLVIPAPRCWTRELAVTRRRVGRLRPARAEPIGVLASLVEMLVRTGVEPEVVEGDVVGETTPLDAGAPQTLQ